MRKLIRAKIIDIKQLVFFTMCKIPVVLLTMYLLPAIGDEVHVLRGGLKAAIPIFKKFFLTLSDE